MGDFQKILPIRAALVMPGIAGYGGWGCPAPGE